MENSSLMVHILHLWTACINCSNFFLAFLSARPISETRLQSQEKLADTASEEEQEASADQQAAAAPPPARVVKNFLSMMDGAGATRGGVGGGGKSRRMEHGAPRLRQLLGSGPLAADAVAASWSFPLCWARARMWPGDFWRAPKLRRETLTHTNM
jgi:hypothetical protein